MIRFAVGEQVIIRYGIPQGKKARIIQIQPADVYKVRVEDGAVLFFSGKGLEKDVSLGRSSLTAGRARAAAV